MRIKKLELQGFKSFKDRTVIMFDQGITGIVGPNGCGKSNIVDALVWVMGETSAKHLRGSTMEDVIFAGSQDYAPVGMAEVSLTLENDGGAFPVKYLNHSEVMVTRRLHRGGESEYLINKESCRLRDIQEIFMDTGAGAKGFSIIEQGQIGKIITSKPSERRSLIEEAAGITKFKARKRESERKLKATDQNLVRLADIIRELKRQLDSLERQAQKAERYRKLKDELRKKELWLAACEVSGGQGGFTDIQGQIEELSDKESFFQTEIQKLQSDIEAERVNSIEKEKELEIQQIEFKTLSEKVITSENEVRELEFEIEQTRRSTEIKGSVYEQNQARLQVVQTEKEDVESKFLVIKEEFEVIDEQYSTLDQQFQIHQSEINEKEDILTSSRKSQLELHQGISHLQASVEGLKERVNVCNEDLTSRSEMKLEVESKNAEFFQRFNDLTKSYDEEKQMKLELVKDTEALTENLSTLKTTQEELAEKRNLETQTYSMAHSKLETLKELQDQFEGYQEGLKNLLVAEKNGDVKNPGQPLSDLINAPEGFEQAVEACLTDGLQGLFGASQLNELDGTIEFLNSDNKGRVQFFVNEVLTEGSKAQGVKTLSTYAVNASSNVKAILEYFYLVEDKNEAVAILKNHQGFCITKSGEMLNSLGQYLTGKTGDGAGLLQRKQNIETLTTEVAQGKTALDSLEKEIAKNKAAVEQVAEELEASKGKDNEQELRVFELKKDLERAEYENTKATAEVEKIATVVSEIQEKLQITMESQEEKLHTMRDLETRKAEQEAMSLDAEESLESLKANYSDLQAEVTDKKIKHASHKSEMESLEQRLESLMANEEQLSGDIGSLEQESAESASFISTYSSDLEVKKAQLERDVELRTELETIVAEMRNEYELLTTTERELGQKVTDYTLQKSKVDSKLGELQVKSEQVRLGLQATVDQMFERYNVDLTETASDYISEYTEDQRDEVKEGIVTLKDKVSRMGEVNLSAISEFDDIKTRYAFLTEQQSDLLKAKNQLEKVILRIDRICSRRFKDTFEAVNERFKKVFPVLFGGGEASLMLVEKGDDDQEPGIDIQAKPPGKKAQNIMLLSGGEKALTAVSLIFSIFLVKPSPYCLLDEVDAPLDDANVFRFNDLVREMAKRSQIILVTHNKNTMAVNNKLYGVTQEEKGVSKMVSVDLDGNFLKEVVATA